MHFENLILDFLKSNSSNTYTISGKTIASYFNISGIRVRICVNHLRRDGFPICSNRWGYYYSEEKKDIEKTISSLRGRVASQEDAISGLTRLL